MEENVIIKCWRCGHTWAAAYHSRWCCPECSEIIRLKIVELKP